MLRSTHPRVVVCSLLLVMSLGGCGGGDDVKRNGLSGKVMLDGAPIQAGSITFIPDANTKGPTAGSNITDGTYSVPDEKGLVEGTYRVEIRSSRETGRQIPAESPSPPGTMKAEVEEAVPAQYNVNSTLEARIPAPDSTLDFDLKSE